MNDGSQVGKGFHHQGSKLVRIAACEQSSHDFAWKLVGVEVGFQVFAERHDGAFRIVGKHIFQLPESCISHFLDANFIPTTPKTIMPMKPI